MRGKDSNLRPSGYEPDELPDCSTPRTSELRMFFIQRFVQLKRHFPCHEMHPVYAIHDRVWTRAQHYYVSCMSIHRLGRPGSDLLFHALRRSTIGAKGFHFRVRDGIGCRPLAMTTRSSKTALKRMNKSKNSAEMLNEKRGKAPIFCSS